MNYKPVEANATAPTVNADADHQILQLSLDQLSLVAGGFSFGASSPADVGGKGL